MLSIHTPNVKLHTLQVNFFENEWLVEKKIPQKSKSTRPWNYWNTRRVHSQILIEAIGDENSSTR